MTDTSPETLAALCGDLYALAEVKMLGEADRKALKQAADALEALQAECDRLAAQVAQLRQTMRISRHALATPSQNPARTMELVVENLDKVLAATAPETEDTP